MTRSALMELKVYSCFWSVTQFIQLLIIIFSESVFSCTSMPDINILLCWICIHDDEKVFRCNTNIQFYFIIHPAYQAAFSESHLPEWSGEYCVIALMVIFTEMYSNPVWLLVVIINTKNWETIIACVVYVDWNLKLSPY